MWPQTAPPRPHRVELCPTHKHTHVSVPQNMSCISVQVYLPCPHIPTFPLSLVLSTIRGDVSAFAMLATLHPNPIICGTIVCLQLSTSVHHVLDPLTIVQVVALSYPRTQLRLLAGSRWCGGRDWQSPSPTPRSHGKDNTGRPRCHWKMASAHVRTAKS